MPTPTTAKAAAHPSTAPAVHSRRLIEEWLPIAALSEESVRERRSMTALPPVYYLHVWWARRPLVASRAAILASLLPPDADRKKFMHMLGIHGDPAATRREIDKARGTGDDLGLNPYGYKRAFTYVPSPDEQKWLSHSVKQFTDRESAVVLDSTAGGGSIPFEAMRLGCHAIANDLNPVAWLILKATVEFPSHFGTKLLERYKALSARFLELAEPRYEGLFAKEPEGVTVDAYLWARTIVCPYTGGVIPLSPNWKLNNKGVGVRLVPVMPDDPAYDLVEAHRLHPACRVIGDKPAAPPTEPFPYMRFEIVQDAKDQSEGTVKGGAARCPFPGTHHNRVIDGDYIKAEAKAGRMGEQLYAVVYTQRLVVGQTATGKSKTKKTRGFRAPRPQDDVHNLVASKLAEKLPEWEAKGIVPDELYPDNTNDDRPRQYGMPLWRDLFHARQLFGHGTSVEVFHELVEQCGGQGAVSDQDAAALVYVAFAMDKMLNYNSRMSVWMPTREVVANTFNRHDFAFCCSCAEMAPTVTGLGYDWAIDQTGKALKELIELSGGNKGSQRSTLWEKSKRANDVSEHRDVTISCGSGDQLPHLDEGTVDAVVLDPPYYNNVMYAELADYFYVWLKRTAGLLFPDPFASHLTDKDREAVANPAKFKAFKQVKGSGGVQKRAARDYQERMGAIFAEARRVLKPDGIMTLMFTHKASGAWDALAKGLVDAGFVITASWPIQTEAEGSLHIKDKNAAKSTIFLVCRPHPPHRAGDPEPETTWWEDVEPQVEEVVRSRVAEFQQAGMGGVDLYLACFGPALEVFSKHWPMKRGRPTQKPEPAKGAQLKLVEEEEFDPYAVRPEDALMAARRAVKDWRFEQLAQFKGKKIAHLDPVTEWFILAWDAFRAAQFPADEALKLARVLGVNFDADLRGKVLEVKGGDVVLWDSTLRAKKGSMGAARSDMILDALHQAAFAVRERNLDAAKRIIEGAELVNRPEWQTGLKCVLEVLPMPGQVSKAAGPVGGAAKDAEALEQVRKLLNGQSVPMASPWMLFETKPETEK